MVSLNNVNNLFPETRDGSVYSDLYKDCYGFRPFGKTFSNLEDFQSSFDHLANVILPRKQAEEKAAQGRAVERFEVSIATIMRLVVNSNREAAAGYLIEAEDKVNDVLVYGYEAIEFHLNLPFGYIKGSL